MRDFAGSGGRRHGDALGYGDAKILACAESLANFLHQPRATQASSGGSGASAGQVILVTEDRVLWIAGKEVEARLGPSALRAHKPRELLGSGFR